MERTERRCQLYADLESVRGALEAAGQDVPQLGARLVQLARTQGRVISALAYGDLSPDDARELRRSGVEARLTTEDGEGSAPESIMLALDAAEHLADGPETDAVVLVTDDAQLTELVRRLRRKGRFVTVVAPAALEGQEPLKSADRAITAESLLAGELPAEAPAPVRELRPRPVAPPLDLERYEWGRLVLLLRDLESKMPFVGMRWLKNKVIGPHNAGVVSASDKQALLNRAVDEGLLETYRVGNRDEGGDPVTACRLVRTNPRVQQILAQNPGPEPLSAAAVDAASEDDGGGQQASA